MRDSELMAHDAFHYRGLKKSGWELWCALLRYGDLSVRDVVQATGRGAKTVRRRLKDFESLGMAERRPNWKWRACEGVNLDEIAFRLGTSGLGKRRRERHERDRRHYRRYPRKVPSKQVREDRGKL
jgi:hypothetical protein